MRKIFTLLFALLLSPCLFSQTSFFMLSGKVLDAETKLPLKNVSIRIQGTLSGTLSDSTGAFDLQASGNSAILNFSMLGYDKKSVKVTKDTKDGLLVELTRKADLLGEVVISADPVQVVSKSRRYNVLDYDFYNDLILLITYVDFDKAKLVLINQDADTLGYKKVPGEPNRLFRDCLGNLHVVCKDSLYQVYYNEKKLSLLPAKSVRDFEKILLPCVAQDSGHFLMVEKYGARLIEADGFHSFFSHNLALSYYCINKKSRQKFPLIYIEDETTMRMSNDEDAFIARKEASGLKTFGDRTFSETLIFKEIYSPLYSIRDTIYVFDYTNGFIKSFDGEKKIRSSVSIDFHKTLGFSRDMVVDRKKNKAFALFESEGITEAKEINLNTGAITASYKIPFAFVTNVKVYDDYMYFIRKEKSDDGTRFLSRIKLH